MTSEYFDAWYADMARSARRDAIVEQALGLPPELQSSSLLPWSGIAEVVDVLGLRAGQTLLDLACGRGGYGLEIARRTGARLVGVDFAAVALDEARRHTGTVDAEFVTGELTAIPLPAASVDAVLCVDAIQFAVPRATALAECLRVLVPGGRIALSCWEPLGAHELIPDRLRDVDLGTELTAAGFAAVEVAEKPDWYAAERDQWRAAVGTDPGDDEALASLRGEGERALARAAQLRRVLATATAP